jgi:peptide-methionine (S)-S-oxide reductase
MLPHSCCAARPIFYTSAEQERGAEDTIADVEVSGRWPGKVVTEVAHAGSFWEAEPEHQDYLERIPDGCHFIRPLTRCQLSRSPPAASNL